MNKSMRRLCILFVLILPSIITAQEWVARYNGPGNLSDLAYAIALDNSGNIYVTGTSYGLGTGTDHTTIKYNAAGVEQWVARYDGPANMDDGASAIAIDDLGNIYVTGVSVGLDTGEDYATIKYDAAGVEQWVARYDGPANMDDGASAIAVDDLGNVYVTGESRSPLNIAIATIKYDAAGVEQWVARYNEQPWSLNHANAITVDSAGNVYVAGMVGAGTLPPISFNYVTFKYDSSGIEQWVAFCGEWSTSYSPYLDQALDIAVDNTGNIYVTGVDGDSVTTADYATVKYSSMGVEQWVARYDGPGDSIDAAEAIAIDTAGNVYVTGWSHGSGTSSDYATVKYDSSGVEQWVARYDGPGNLSDLAYAIALDNSGNIYVTGTSYGSGTLEDYATIKYDAAGVEQWVARYNGYNGSTHMDDGASAIAVDDLGNVYVTGWSWYYCYDYATIKYSPTGIKEDELTMTKGNEITATIFCGPLQLPEGKKCKVVDITGRVVEPDKIQPGIYFIEVDGVVTQKVVKIR